MCDLKMFEYVSGCLSADPKTRCLGGWKPMVVFLLLGHLMHFFCKLCLVVFYPWIYKAAMGCFLFFANFCRKRSGLKKNQCQRQSHPPTAARYAKRVEKDHQSDPVVWSCWELLRVVGKLGVRLSELAPRGFQPARRHVLTLTTLDDELVSAQVPQALGCAVALEIGDKTKLVPSKASPEKSQVRPAIQRKVPGIESWNPPMYRRSMRAVQDEDQILSSPLLAAGVQRHNGVGFPGCLAGCKVAILSP